TRNIPTFRDPAAILIDQLKTVHVVSELEVIDTSVWQAKVTRKEYSVALNNTGVGVDDPDVNLYENYSCNSERNYTHYCDKELDPQIDRQSEETDREKRKRLVWEIERKLAEDLARPMIYHDRAATCWYPRLKGFVLHRNGTYSNWRFEDVWLE